LSKTIDAVALAILETRITVIQQALRVSKVVAIEVDMVTDMIPIEATRVGLVIRPLVLALDSEQRVL
jgi:hypothetical protein